MKIPSTIKLIGILTHKSFDIFRKNKQQDGPLIRVMFGEHVSTQIIRHSNAGIILKEVISEPNDVKIVNQVELTFENSYIRDLLALCFKELNQLHLGEMSKTELKELDFVRRREAYLEKQMTINQAKFNQEVMRLKQLLTQKDTQVQEVKTLLERQLMATEEAVGRANRLEKSLQETIGAQNGELKALRAQLESCQQELQYAQADNQIR